MYTLTMLLLVTAPAGTPAEKIADQIVQAGHQRIGVIPSVISRQGEREATVGSLGPRARTIPKTVYDQLVTLSQSGKYRGQFTVVSDRVMRNAINEVARNRSLTVDDLGNPRALNAMSRYTGAKGFVALNFAEEADIVTGESDAEQDLEDQDSSSTTSTTKPTKRKSYEEFDIQGFDADGDQFLSDSVRDRNLLSTVAYMGDSFEVLRWNGTTLTPLGLESNHEQFEEGSNWQFGKGKKWEQLLYQKLKSTLEHPFDSDGFPYEVRVRVDGAERKRQKINGKYVVRLEPGEEYVIELQNRTDQPALIALFIDGVNSIDRELREPLQLESRRHWVINANQTGKVSGWFNIDSKQAMQKGNRFRIVERDESVAAQKGFFDNIGTITAIFYVNDVASGKHINYPDEKLLDNLRGSFADSLFGTGTGEEFDRTLQFAKVKRGLLLAAVTLYYRSQQELDDIEAGSSEDFLFDDTNTELLALDDSRSKKKDRPDGDKPKKDQPKKDDIDLIID